MFKSLVGMRKPVQLMINPELFQHGPILTDLPVGRRGDCGANTLFLLGALGIKQSRELGKKQQSVFDRHVAHTSAGLQLSAHEYEVCTPEYQFKELYKDLEKDYLSEEVLFFDAGIKQVVDNITPGYGTIIRVDNRSNTAGHFVALVKDNDGNVGILDNQNSRGYTIDEFMRLNTYTVMTVLTEQRKRFAPTNTDNDEYPLLADDHAEHPPIAEYPPIAVPPPSEVTALAAATPLTFRRRATPSLAPAPARAPTQRYNTDEDPSKRQRKAGGKKSKRKNSKNRKNTKRKNTKRKSK